MYTIGSCLHLMIFSIIIIRTIYTHGHGNILFHSIGNGMMICESGFPHSCLFIPHALYYACIIMCMSHGATYVRAQLQTQPSKWNWTMPLTKPKEGRCVCLCVCVCMCAYHIILLCLCIIMILCMCVYLKCRWICDCMYWYWLYFVSKTLSHSQGN